jgi:nucleotide-binding universal stress UspA family protein
MNEIVVGIDQSPGSQRALEWALEEAKLRQATVRLVHAVPPPQSYYPYSMVELDRLEAGREEPQQAARELLESALASAGGEPAGVSVEVVPRFGAAPDVLVEESGAAALLVVGSRGRGGFAGLLLGSVSQRAVHHARCPVVVIPAER